ncbi:MAG: signal recognition particle protein, partial [Bacilli bacterium]
MMVGLQGSGKTTTAGKLSLMLRKKHNKKTLLIACDVYRPAAIDQLKQIGRELNVEVYSEGLKNPVEIASNGLIYAKENGFNYVIIDTAGRLHIDEELMDELKNINQKVKPNEILLVVDSMTGQDAINVINGFNESLPLTGAVLTKLDGDTRGGAALSIRHLTNIPIKFIGVSEKMDGLEEFYPDRMATRILGMGDLMSMLEKAESVIDEKEALEATKKMQNGKFDLEDFLSQFKAIKKMGPLENIIKMLPNAKKMGLTDVKVDPKDMAHVEAIILSMTPYERRHPDILKATRKVRIANGSGRSVEEVNRLLKQFEQMKLMMKQFKNGNFKLPF